ncbi:MAG: gas vesicle protein GvpG [Planctomycetota bacterium]
MFLFDDILLSPVKGFLFIAEKVRDAAIESQQAEAASLTKELSSLYEQLESGALSEDEFDELEEALLDRLETLRSDDDDDDEDADDDGPVDGVEQEPRSSFSISVLGDDEDPFASFNDDPDDNEDDEEDAA